MKYYVVKQGGYGPDRKYHQPQIFCGANISVDIEHGLAEECEASRGAAWGEGVCEVDDKGELVQWTSENWDSSG